MSLPKTLTCKKCGTLYSETLPRCPKCGTVHVEENSADQSLTKAMIIAAVVIGVIAFLGVVGPFILSIIGSVLSAVLSIVILIISAIFAAVSDGFFSSDFFNELVYGLINFLFFF